VGERQTMEKDGESPPSQELSWILKVFMSLSIPISAYPLYKYCKMPCASLLSLQPKEFTVMVLSTSHLDFSASLLAFLPFILISFIL
jgi:hypothetical protein